MKPLAFYEQQYDLMRATQCLRDRISENIKYLRNIWQKKIPVNGLSNKKTRFYVAFKIKNYNIYNKLEGKGNYWTSFNKKVMEKIIISS